jgi:acyl-CoA synthetase (AMP-forming)/AMP-acid ligase II
MPEATEGALRDGWYHSGDLASMDAEGYVYLSDRRTDLIVSGGMNVYPNEVELCIMRLEGVAECAVVGVPHERWGHAVAAAVVREPSSDVDAAAVVAQCRANLASYKKPLWVVFYDDLPRTASLKLRRSVIRDLVAAEIAAKEIPPTEGD